VEFSAALSTRELTWPSTCMSTSPAGPSATVTRTFVPGMVRALRGGSTGQPFCDFDPGGAAFPASKPCC
jgi:hypothetical protein